jgi:hypothetical protein
MPCDSHAAALIACGALRNDLEDGNANNLEGHFQYLIRSRDSLTVEEKNSFILIDDARKKWKFTDDKNPTQIILKQANYSEHITRKRRQIPNPAGPVLRIIFPGKANSIRVSTEAEVEISDEGRKLLEKDYKLIPNCTGEILDENLARSYYGILLVGKATGMDAMYVNKLYEVNFNDDKDIVSLGTLLTLHHNKDKPISRLKFCNFGSLERQIQGHYLVIADSARAFCLALQHFKKSDVIGVTSRDEPAENIENLANQLGSMRRHYIERNDDSLLEFASKALAMCIYEKR